VFFGDDSLHQRSITRASREVVAETVAALSLADWWGGWSERVDLKPLQQQHRASEPRV